jgi:hypothetical protein
MKKLIILAPLTFATACAQSTLSGIDAPLAARQICEPIYGRAADWAVISDDLARNIYRHNRICETWGE